MELLKYIKKDKKRFAKAVGIDLSTLYRWLAGTTSPTFDELVAILRVVNDNPSEVIAFFEDLISKEPCKSSPEAISYIKGLAHIKAWKEAFK